MRLPENIPHRDDPCWQDAEWRTGRLIELMAKHGLSRAQVAAMTGNKPTTVRMWTGAHPEKISARALRLLCYDLHFDAVA